MAEITSPSVDTELSDPNDLAKAFEFVCPQPEIAGLKLRPLSAGTLIILKATKNGLLDGNESETEFDVASFLYVHSADPREVRKACANPEVFKDKVLEFAEGISVPDFIKSTNQIQILIEAAAVGNDYEVKAQPSDQPIPNS